VGSTGSTNTDLAAEARAGDHSSAVLVADHQTAGRGRLDRVWKDTAAGGQLLVSFRIPVASGKPEDIGPALAVAAQTTLEAAGVAARIKWPNDLGVVRADGSFVKLAGYLGEFVDGPTPTVVVGMGLNVSEVPVADATCVVDEGGELDRDGILAGMLERLPALLADAGSVRARLVDRSATLGSRVRIERAGDVLVGTATALDDAGRLLVDDGVRVHAIAVGDVIHLRSTDA